MTAYNLNAYMPVIILVGFAIIMIVGALIVGRFIRPHNPSDLKETVYECGEAPMGVAWSNFHVRFYVLALVFIIFDVEGALMFPVAVIFRKFNEIGSGSAVFVSLLLFIGVLLAGLVYCWSKGDLDWVKSYTQQSFNEERDEKKLA
ncbi:MAG: NADH-quinone oxidoreductase subunit A [Bacteriovoracaceae bacterium]|jgi:NADH-quinone oxidoreductase subunit A|nr:NADH-quinone oxidoreductase subunit A [Bacteriovoracaceae bacterium]